MTKITAAHAGATLVHHT